MFIIDIKTEKLKRLQKNEKMYDFTDAINERDKKMFRVF